MKFRTISRLRYLKMARHRHGHGIHSPFLFRLITTVVEAKDRLPEYDSCKKLKNKALEILELNPDLKILKSYHPDQYLPVSPGKLYKKVELPVRYGKLVFRLIREFEPSVIQIFGPAFGVNLYFFALANIKSKVFQAISHPFFEPACRNLLGDLTTPNIFFSHENEILFDQAGFVIVNYAEYPERTQSVFENKLERIGDDDVFIIRGIHESKEMEAVWFRMIGNLKVRVSLDLFEIGILLFRKGLQKEDFIHRF